jgi:hypothetical protein
MFGKDKEERNSDVFQDITFHRSKPRKDIAVFISNCSR